MNAERRGSVQLFATCIVEHVKPEVGLAVVNVLERAGWRVHYPEGQTCCGQPAFNAGAWDDDRAMARHTIGCLERSIHDVVVPSGSCADMIVHRYGELFADSPGWAERARAVSRRTREFTAQLDAVGYRPPARTGVPTCVYHASCHLLRGLGRREGPLQLLKHAIGDRLVPLAESEDCCGFGGLFSVKMPDLSAAMLQRKLTRIEESGAAVVTACDVSCLVHIEGGLRRRGSPVAALHVAQLLDGLGRNVQ